MATVELKDSEWKEFSKADYAIIDCYGDNCGACVMLEPVFDALADDMPKVAFGRVNISFFSEIADQFSIDSMPTLLYFRKGELVNKTVGSMDREDLLEAMSDLLYS